MYVFGPIYAMALIDALLTVALLYNGASEDNPLVRGVLVTFGGTGYIILRVAGIGLLDTLMDVCNDGAVKTWGYNLVLWTHLVFMGLWALWVHIAGVLV